MIANYLLTSVALGFFPGTSITPSPIFKISNRWITNSSQISMMHASINLLTQTHNCGHIHENSFSATHHPTRWHQTKVFVVRFEIFMISFHSAAHSCIWSHFIMTCLMNVQGVCFSCRLFRQEKTSTLRSLHPPTAIFFLRMHANTCAQRMQREKKERNKKQTNKENNR